MHAHNWKRLIGGMLLLPASAFAGMPSPELTDIARLRLNSLSVFFVGWLLCAWLVQKVWNGQRNMFPSLPHMSFKRACGFLIAWGFAALLVLTMISGARELLTPGAWEKVGLTYRLKTPPSVQPAVSNDSDKRRQKLEKLRAALWAHAASHEGKLPDSSADPEIAPEFWTADDASGTLFICVPGKRAHVGAAIAVIEPRLYTDGQLVLLTSGEIRLATTSEIQIALAVPVKK